MRPHTLTPYVSRFAACLTLLSCACVDEPRTPAQDMGSDAQADLAIDMDMARIARIEIVLDGVTPELERIVQQGDRLQLKVQAFDVTGRLMNDNIIAQTTVSFIDMMTTGVTESSHIERPPLVLGQRGNIVEVIERGRASITVSIPDTILSDTVILDASKSSSRVGTLPRLTTLRKGEPLYISQSLAITTSEGTTTPLIPECLGAGEITTTGVISLSAVDVNTGLVADDLSLYSTHQVVGERPGIGKLIINCPALAQSQAPSMLEYTFRVDSATEVTAGAEHTCALVRPQTAPADQPASDLLCWGKNERGQIGVLLNGKRQDVTSPTPIIPSSQAPIEVDTGEAHTCALIAGEAFEQGTRSGDLYCWGDDTYGQTAPQNRERAPESGASVERPTLYSSPVDLSMQYMKFARVCTGAQYSCALSDRGRLLCWGDNSHGQLGESVALGEQTTQPTELFELERYQELSCGAQHVCATTFNGESQCWGRNHLGQLGVPQADTPLSQTPVVLQQSSTPFAFETLALGEHTSCGIQDNNLFCWGDNRSGQLTSFVQERVINAPTRISLSGIEGERVESISFGTQHACAITTTDTLPTTEEQSCLVRVLAEGDQNDQGTTCADFGEDNLNARDAWRDEGIAGEYKNCLTTRLYCWGDARWGQVTKLDEDRYDIPQELSCQALPPYGTPAAKAFDFGPGGTLVRADDYRSITTGDTHSCAAGRTTIGTRDPLTKQITSESKEKIWCWGRSDNGKTGSRAAGLVKPSASSTFKKLGQLEGDTFKGDSNRPVGQPRQLALGRGHSCTRTCLPGDNPFKENGDSCEDLFDAQHHVMCWGSNQHGQRARVEGFNAVTSMNTLTPSAFQIERSRTDDSATIQTLSSGADHMCASFQKFSRDAPEDPRIAWNPTKSLRCWGKNTHQQAGASLGNSPHGSPATGISGGPDLECPAINFSNRLGELHTCAFTLTHDPKEFFKEKYSDMDNELAYAFGSKTYQCWNETRTDTRPNTNSFNDLAFSPRGQAYCWGNGNKGQHGLSSTLMADARPAPSQRAGGSSAYFNGLASSDFLNCGWRNFFATGAGEVQCWGADPTGLVKDWGDTPEEDRIIYQPVQVEGWNMGETLRDKLKSIVIMAMGESHICVMTNPQNGYVVCWGDNTYGQLGGDVGARRSARDAHFITLSENDELTEVQQLTSGNAHTCALTSAQKLYCWGRNDRGQVGAFDGFGNVSDNLYAVRTPYEIKTFEDRHIKEIQAFHEHTCALVADNVFDNSPTSIHCWGANDLGQSACWHGQDITDPASDDRSLCTSTTPWSRQPFITQVFP